MGHGIDCFDLVLIERDSQHKYKNAFCVVSTAFEDLENDKHKFLHSNELDYFNGLEYLDRKRSFLMGRCSAKSALIRLHTNLLPADINIANGVFEFPYIDAPNFVNSGISLSHCNDNAVAIAYTQSHPMAVDIEAVAEDRQAVIKSQLNPIELQMLENVFADLSTGLTVAWTAKEALSKVLKCGLLIDFKLLEISSITALDGKYVLMYQNFPQYKAQAFAVNKMICCIVFPEKTELNCGFIS